MKSSNNPTKPFSSSLFAIFLSLFTFYLLLFASPAAAQNPIPHTLGRIESLGPLGDILARTQTQRLLNTFISGLLGFFTIIASLWFLTQFIIGAFQWLSAGGNQESLTKARQQLINAIIGLTIIVAAYAITGLVASLLGIPIFDPLSILPHP